jgi:hypothetical protein
MRKVSPTLEALYDRYSAVLYGVALEISPTETDAESILISTFKKCYKPNLNIETGSLLITLIKLMIQTAHDKFHTGTNRTNFTLKIFENTPMLHRSLCDQNGFEGYCSEKMLSRQEGFKQMREEFFRLQRQG